MKSVQLWLLTAASALPWLAPEMAQAQSDSNGGLQEIIVTAQKREQTLQDVPVSVAVVSAEALTQNKISGVEGLGLAVPNLVVTSTPFQPYVAIRGLGSGGGARALEQSVATYVDGVYAGRANQFLNPFFDVERVEVVRGPQGVLFGINANAGGINIVNKKPDKIFAGYVIGGYEFENDGYNVEGAVSIPLTSNFGVRLAGRHNRDGGYLHNRVTGQDEPETDASIGRFVASWRPDDGLTADFSYEHSHKQVDGSPFQAKALPPGAFPPAVEDGKVDFNKTSAVGRGQGTTITSDNLVLNLSKEIGALTLSSTTGYSRFKFRQSVMAGYTPVYFGTALAKEKFRQFYQELRLASPTGDFFEYLAGATYFHQRDRIDQGIDVDLSIFGATGVTSAVRNGFDQMSEAYSGFGQGTFNLTDKLNLVAGVRYTHVRKSVDYVISATNLGAPLRGYSFNPTSAVINSGIGWMLYVDPTNSSTVRPTFYDRKRNFEALNPSVSLNYKFSRRLSAYASFTTGTKAGGFNDQEKTGIAPENGYATDDFSFASEKARNFEVGAKAELGKARFDLAVFHARYTNMQVSQTVLNGVKTSNAASAKASGFETSGQVLMTPQLLVGADFSYIHARYGDFPGAGCITPRPVGCNPLTANAKGGRLDGVPEVTGSVFADYTIPLHTGLDLKLHGRAYYNDGAQFGSDQDPVDRVPSYWLFDARAELTQGDKGWSLALTGKNLANKVVQGYSLDASIPLFGHQVIVLPGRQVYLDLRFRF